MSALSMEAGVRRTAALLRMMRFSRLRRSRLMMTLAATAWFPCVMVCCIGTPLQAAGGSTPSCHDVGAIATASAQADTYESSSRQHETSRHHADAQDSGEAPPTRTCCELSGREGGAIEQIVDFDAQPVIVAVALVIPRLTASSPFALTQERIDVHDHGPPIYLSNVSFLI
jgi:hypothetical protein